ncbi:PilW family protein [Demequina sp. NBRC 110051]|uniref:PilW family protein n=1 Tax=Demequina sp. NBRC 110051 TaxID=1570340 RepID=UPI0009FFF7B1|nr:prepilin-type N-terminal cleavage/methylation domain-containing protein [Demequina sp. NBRC 110051]
MLNSFRLRKEEHGFTLVELVVTMAVFSVIMAIVFAVLIQMMGLTKESVARSDSIQQARLGLSQIELQVRSGAVIRNPEAENVADSGASKFYSMRILTELNGNPTCAQWRVVDSAGSGRGNLEFRTWDPAYPVVEQVSDWGVVARDLVLVDVAPEDSSDIDPEDAGTWPPFWVDDSVGGDTEAQFVRVTLRLKSAEQSESSKPTSVTTMVTGRNTVFGNYTDESCSPVPAP